MALEVMGYNTKIVEDGVEILYNSSYTGAAVTLDTSAFTDGVCKAGTPVTKTGTKATGDDALGVLLHDVYQERPQGTAVYYGTIRTDVAEAHFGGTYSDGIKTALKNVVFM